MIFGKPPDHLIKVATLIKDFWKLWVNGIASGAGGGVADGVLKAVSHEMRF